MNIQQLRYLHEIAKRGLNVSEAAAEGDVASVDLARAYNDAVGVGGAAIQEGFYFARLMLAVTVECDNVLVLRTGGLVEDVSEGGQQGGAFSGIFCVSQQCCIRF